MPIPLPLSKPVTVVVSVMAGVVVAFATVPAKPLVEITDNVETVPAVYPNAPLTSADVNVIAPVRVLKDDTPVLEVR